MIKIGKSASCISVYTCQPQNKGDLEEIIEERIDKEGPNCDLNDIDTSLITNMSYLFYKTDFNGNISNWNVSNVDDMCCMFMYSKFNGDISRWDVSKVEDTSEMFKKSKFNQDISKWNINEYCDTRLMFDNCPIREKFKPKSLQNQ